jgi:Rrf2 family transcriptional regulator, nitric oxide-sensitive transcriptional repressor
MFSLTHEHALRVIVHLATTYPKPVKNADIAADTQVPSSYLYKVLQFLDHAGLVTTVRGLHGGYTLTRPPETINAMEVIEAVSPFRRLKSRPAECQSPIRHLCPLHKWVDHALTTFEGILRKSTVADLLDKSAFHSPHCPGVAGCFKRKSATAKAPSLIPIDAQGGSD